MRLPIVFYFSFFAAHLHANSSHCAHEWAPDKRPDSIKQMRYASGAKIESAFQPCNYFGFGYGLSFLSPEDDTGSWSNKSDSPFSTLLTFGRHLSTNWLIEAFYTRLNNTTIQSSQSGNSVSAKLEYKTWGAFAKYYVLDSDSLNFYIKSGISHVRIRSSNNLVGYDKQTSKEFSLGAGLTYRYEGSPWSFMIDYTQFAPDAGLLSVQWSRYFGHESTFISDETVVFTPYENNHLQGDSDGDQVIDEFDMCPHTSPGVKVNASGCCTEKEGCFRIQ